MEFSIIIPLDFHRSRALDCVRGWVTTQRMPADDFELICVLPSDDPDRLGDLIRPLLRPHDRLVLCDAHHDMDLYARGAALARGTYLFFTESHVWPEHDVLLASKQVFDEHPDWAAFSCKTTRVAPNRLAQLEADLYEHDINQAMKAHPWLKILDHGFLARRDVYRKIGGFDPDLGHFAEWALAARYFDRGLTVGYVPHVTLRHFYSGDLKEFYNFTASFIEGEMRYYAQGGDRDRIMQHDAMRLPSGLSEAIGIARLRAHWRPASASRFGDGPGGLDRRHGCRPLFDGRPWLSAVLPVRGVPRKSLWRAYARNYTPLI